MKTFQKDPDARLDYTGSWAKWLATAGGDAITASSWTVPDGIVEDGVSFTDDTTTIWLKGGTVGEKYRITNHIETAGGREDDRTILVEIVEK